jgi:hypothetical protein
MCFNGQNCIIALWNELERKWGSNIRVQNHPPIHPQTPTPTHPHTPTHTPTHPQTHTHTHTHAHTHTHTDTITGDIRKDSNLFGLQNIRWTTTESKIYSSDSPSPVTYGSVGKVMGYRLNGRGPIPRRDEILLSSLQHLDRPWDPPSILSNGWTIYFHSPIRLHVVVFNKLSTWTNLC